MSFDFFSSIHCFQKCHLKLRSILGTHRTKLGSVDRQLGSTLIQHELLMNFDKSLPAKVEDFERHSTPKISGRESSLEIYDDVIVLGEAVSG